MSRSRFTVVTVALLLTLAWSGRTLARLGQKRVDEARAWLNQVPTSDPYYKAAQDRLAQLDPRR